MKAYSFWLLALVSITELAQAKQTKELLPDGELEAFISEGELSRIKVIDDRIKAVRSNQGDLELLEDAKAGDIYIRPARPGKAPINIFVTTEQSHTYKLLLIPQKMPSEQIFIKNKATVASTSEKRDAHLSIKETVIKLVKDMQIGRESKSFKRTQVEELLAIEGNHYNKTTIYTGKSIIGEVLEFQNDGEEHFRLSPEIFTSLKGTQLIAISIDQCELSPGEKTKIYLVKRV